MLCIKNKLVQVQGPRLKSQAQHLNMCCFHQLPLQITVSGFLRHTKLIRTIHVYISNDKRLHVEIYESLNIINKCTLHHICKVNVVCFNNVWSIRYKDRTGQGTVLRTNIHNYNVSEYIDVLQNRVHSDRMIVLLIKTNKKWATSTC